MIRPHVQLKTVRTPEQMLGVMAFDCSSHQDPWARHWIVLPGEGPAEWVRQRWALRSGVSARSQVLNLRTLLESPLAKDVQSRFSLEKLEMAIATHLAIKNMEEAESSTEQDHPSIDEKILSHAKTIAEALDLGLLARSEPKDFSKSALMKELMADPKIQLLLNQHLAKANDYQQQCRQWVESWQHRGGFPQLWIGLDAGLPFVLWQRLMDMMSCCEASKITIYQLSPAEVYWGDLSLKRKNCDPAAHPGPLLKHFGKRLQDLHNQVLNSFLGDGDGGTEYQMPESTERLLSRLQECCHHVAFPTAMPFDAADHSFEVHSARSPLRELEICRDRILQAMSEDPQLRPEEILVLLVEPETYSPLVMSAFQPQLEAERWIPFSLSSHCLQKLNPFSDAMNRLFRVLSGRVQRQDLLDLLEDSYIAQQFNFETMGTEMFTWLLEGNFSWGCDREHRREEQEFDDPRWSLKFVMERLALGALCAPQDLNKVITTSSLNGKKGDIVERRVPLERASGIGVQHLAGLARLVKALMVRHKEWNAEVSRSLEEWIELSYSLMEQFIPKVHDQDLPEVILFKSSLELLKNQLESSIGLTHKAYLKLLRPQLENLNLRGASSGGVKIGSLQQDAGLPAKMICVLGLSSDIFPRREDRPPWHPLAGASQLGDPDRREDDRHHLLMALLSCSDRFNLSYLGGSDTDHRDLPPSTPLSDLIDAARQCCGLTHQESSPFIFRHGLNGFSPQSHFADTPNSARSYSHWDQLECEALLNKSEQGLPSLWNQVNKKDASPLLSRNDLRLLLREAPRLFLSSMNIVLPSESEGLEEGEPLGNDGLQKYKMKHELLKARIQQLPEEHCFELWRTNGLLPPQKMGEEVLAKIINEVPTVDTELSLSEIRAHGRIDFSEWGVDAQLEVGTSLQWYRDQDGLIHHFSIRNLNNKSREFEMLEIMLDWLCICWSEEQPTAKLHFTKVKNNFDLHAPMRNYIPSLLLDLVQLTQMASKIPLPMWKETYEGMGKHNISHDDADQSSEEKEKRTQALEDEFQSAWEGGFGDFSPPASRPLTRIVFRNCHNVGAWRGPKGFDYSPFQLAENEALAAGVFRWVKSWESRIVEALL